MYILTKFKKSVDYLYEKFKMRNYAANEIFLPIYLQLWCLIPTAIVLSFFINPGDTYITDQFFVSLGIFSEALGILPQFYMIRKKKKRMIKKIKALLY